MLTNNGVYTELTKWVKLVICSLQTKTFEKVFESFLTLMVTVLRGVRTAPLMGAMAEQDR